MSIDQGMKAAEYVLGTLDAAERADFARALVTDRGLQAETAVWEASLGRLAGYSDVLEPSDGLWPRIDAGTREAFTPAAASNVVQLDLRRSVQRWRVTALMTSAIAASLALFVSTQSAKPPVAGQQLVAQAVTQQPLQPLVVAKAPEPANVVLPPAEQTASAQVPAAAKPETPVLAKAEPVAINGATTLASASKATPENSQLQTAGAVADPSGRELALSVARSSGDQGITLSGPAPRPAQPAPRADDNPLMAMLSRSGDVPALVVRFDPAARVINVRPVALDAPDGRSLQLWQIGADDVTRPLGLVARNGSRIAVPREINLAEGSLIVSAEPEGGSTSGKPSDTIIFKGKMLRE